MGVGHLAPGGYSEAALFGATLISVVTQNFSEIGQSAGELLLCN